MSTAAVDYSTLSAAELMERFESLITELNAVRKALKKAAKVKRAPKLDEAGEPIKRTPSVWAAWSQHAKATYAKEYEAFVASAAADGKKQGLVPVFAKQAKEKHAADYEAFAAHYVEEHPPKSSSGSVVSGKKAAKAVETTDDEGGSIKSRSKKAAGGAGAGAGAAAAPPSDSEAKPKKAKKAAPATTDLEAEAPAAAKPKAKREAKVPAKKE
jgi:hypothetical protein